MMQKEYPEECIRGVSNQTDLIENNTKIKANVFQFQYSRCNDDGWIRESINWKDNENAVNFTLKQKKKNQFQFIAIAIIPRDELDDLKKTFQSSFDYERPPIEEVNPYHGNLLLKKETEKHIKNMIKFVLAYHSTVIMRDDPPS